jgi:hypothetical protein
VFTTLLSYADVPAFWAMVGRAPSEIPISYVSVDGRWCMVDVRRSLIFTTTAGSLASVADVERNPAMIAAVAAALPDADAYVSHFAGYRAPLPPEESRADMQRPWRRLSFELRRLIGAEGRTWQMRPQAVAGVQP